MPSNTEKETLWVEGWNALHDACVASNTKLIVDAEWKELAPDAAQGLIQNMAYQAQKVSISPVWHKGKQSLQLKFSSWAPSA